MNIPTIFRQSAADDFSSLSHWKRAGLLFIFLWFFIGGLAHFYFLDLEVKIVPPWLPFHRELVLISGIFELVGAIGILFPLLAPVGRLGIDDADCCSNTGQFVHAASAGSISNDSLLVFSY